MTKTKSTKRALLMSALAMLVCVSMLIGSTFAWFTDSVASGLNKIQSGNLDIKLEHSYGFYDGPLEEVNSNTKLFKYNVKGEEILWEPGVSMVEYFKVSNTGNLALKFEFNLVADNATKTADGKTLLDVLRVEAMQSSTNAEHLNSLNSTHIPDPTVHTPYELNDFGYGTYLLPGEYVVFAVHVTWEPTDYDNDYNVPGGLQLDLGVMLVATQYTYESDSMDDQYDKDATYPEINTVDTWDGTADTSWYDPASPITEYAITTAEQLAGLAELVSGDTTFKGVTFTLANDLDLYCEDTSENADGDPVTFRPIGDYSKGGTFEGVFDGNGKTISNLYQNGWDLGYDWYNYGSYGLFGNVNNATIKNLTLSGGESYIEGGDTSFVAGSATGTCVFENITIEDSVSATYNNGNGGIIGWSGAGNYTFKNITIAEDCVLAGLWGSFDSSIGGIVGQGEPGATYNFENVDIACRIDAYNDCTASYDYYNYRMCGMIIGRLAKTTTIDGSNYPDMSQYNITCNDVTVTYGDWANYHYCEPTPANMNGGRGMRVESGYSYDGLPADYDHSQCVDSHMNLIPFDQIFGGDQLGVKGLKTHEGVTVIYNNK